MIGLKTFCLSFLLSGLFLSCSSAQDKPLSTPTPTPSPNLSLSLVAERFESIEGDFAISIFQAPFKIQNFGTEVADKKGIDVGKIYMWNVGKMVYLVMYVNPFDQDGNEITHTLKEFDEGVRIATRRKQARIISEKSIFLDKYSGTEFRYISSDGVNYITRNYLVGLRGYQIMAGYAEKDKKEALKVLDSFELLPDKLK